MPRSSNDQVEKSSSNTPYFDMYNDGMSIDAMAEEQHREPDFVLAELVRECASIGKNSMARNFKSMITTADRDGVYNLGNYDLS